MDNYETLYKKYKNKAIDLRSKNIVMSEMERNIIEDFCKENNISYSHLMNYLLYKDGAFTDDLISARKKVYPKSKINFSDRQFTYKYKDKYNEYMDYNRKPKNFNLKKVEFDIIEDYERKRGFTSFARYGRHLLNSIDVYPAGFYDKIMEKTKETYDRKNKKRETKTLEEHERKVRTLSDDDEFKHDKVIVTMNSAEKKHIITPFVDEIKQHRLTVQDIMRFKLYELGVLSKEEAKIDDETLFKILAFSYKKECNDIDKIIDDIELARKRKEYTTLTVILPKNPKIRKTFTKYIPVLFRVALYERGAYGSRECLELFAHPNKLKIVEDIIEKL